MQFQDRTPIRQLQATGDRDAAVTTTHPLLYLPRHRRSRRARCTRRSSREWCCATRSMPSSRESARPRLSPPHRLPPSPPGSAPLAPSHRRPRVHRHHLLSPPPPLLLRRASPRDSHRVCLPHSHRPPPTPSCILQTSSRPHPSPPAPSQAPFTGSMAFKQMERLARRDCLREAARETHSPAGPLSPSQENIANFSTACESLGVPKFSLFQTVTLYENKARPTTPPPRTHPPPPPCTRPPLRPAPPPPAAAPPPPAAPHRATAGRAKLHRTAGVGHGRCPAHPASARLCGAEGAPRPQSSP